MGEDQIHSPPEIVCLPVDLHENLVEMPSPIRICMGLNSPLSYLRCEHGAETVPPISNRFMANIDATFVQQIFNVAKR